MKANKFTHIIGSISRTLLAITFLFSGFVKAVDPLGTVYKIEDYLKAFGGWCNDLLPYAGIAAVCLIALEFLLGVCLLTNVRTKWTSWLTLLFMLVMTPLTLWIALTNPVSDCGCFGDALVLTNWQTFYKNLVLLVLVIILLCCQKAIPQTFSWWMELVIAVLGLGIAGGMMYYSYTHLPPMDFRPYKIGNYLPELMEIPEEYVSDTTIVTLTYEKNGIEQQFDIFNYPKNDPEWRFVDQNTILAKKIYQNGKLKGVTPVKEYTPPIHDFEIENYYIDEPIEYIQNSEYGEFPTEGNLMEYILYSMNPITLVIMYDLNKTDRKQIDKLRNIIHNRSDVYFITGSGEDEIYEFAEELGWDEETTLSTFCYCEPVTLKTIVRANPGLVIIQNGTVMEKKNFRQVEFEY